MNRINIYRTATKEQTSIPNVFIDEYMGDANDAQLKIYLFLIRMMNANLPTSVADLADKFNYTEKDVLRALMYWESRQLLSLEFDAAQNLSGIQVLSLENTANPPQSARRITPVLSLYRPGRTLDGGNGAVTRSADRILPGSRPDNAAAGRTVRKPDYSPEDLKQFKANEDIEQLLMVTEQYMGRHLSRTDMETVLFLYDGLSFSTELIDYLVQYCVERGKKDFRYMEKVALAWHEQGITSPKDAQGASRKYDKTVYTIMKSLGKPNAPAPKELEYIEKWTEKYGFLLDVIQEACDKTVMNTDRNRFAYADGILSKWYQAGVHHKSDISAADESYRHVAAKAEKPKKTDARAAKNKFNSFSQNAYDFEELEESILSN